MDERERRWEQRFEWPMVIAALLTIPALVLEESPIGEPGHTIAVVINWVTWSAFAIELVVMLSVVHHRRRWLVQHPIDVAVVVLSPPFLPAALQWARFLRVFRVLPLFRAHTLRRILSLQGIRYASLVVGIIVLAGGTAFSAIEGNGLSAWDGVWFAVETVTTVGYGDIVPTTSAGRVVAMIIMFVGIGFVALLTGFVADRFINRERTSAADEQRGEILSELRRISERLERLERKAS
jgi:voltage-gated potassium channel